jgi:hypothetical protein
MPKTNSKRAAIAFRTSVLVFYFFFASPKKKQKRSPAKDYIPFAGRFPDQAFVLL